MSLVSYSKGSIEEEYEEVCVFFLIHLLDMLNIPRFQLRKPRVLFRREERLVFSLSSQGLLRSSDQSV